MGRDLSPGSDCVSSSHVQDYSNSVVNRCVKRTFITPEKERYGLVPQKTQKGDLVYILFSGEVAYILRKLPPELGGTPGNIVGEAYLHRVIEG